MSCTNTTLNSNKLCVSLFFCAISGPHNLSQNFQSLNGTASKKWVFDIVEDMNYWKDDKNQYL